MYDQQIPAITTAQMREVDRLMVEEYGIELLQMMENAGRHLARFAARRFLDGNPVGKGVVVLAGSGGNGGGAMVAARRLRSWGAVVDVWLTRPRDELAGVPAHQAEVAERVGCAFHGTGTPAEKHAVVLDGLVGYSLSGALTGRSEELATWANGQSAPVVSLDVPSGLDATTGIGTAAGVVVDAEATLTLALPKTGLLADGAAAHVGELYLADIGVPPELYEGMGLSVGPVFAADEIVRLR